MLMISTILLCSNVNETTLLLRAQLQSGTVMPLQGNTLKPHELLSIL